MFGEGNNIEPTLFVKEIELVSLGFWSCSFDVFTSTGFQECTDISTSKFFGSYENLEADHQQECNFVFFKKTAVNVFMDMFRHDLDNKIDSFLRRIGFRRFLGKGPVEKLKELFKRTIVHPIDQEQLDEGKVESRSSNSHRSILLSFFVDFFGLNFSIVKFNGHFLGLSLGVV